MERVYERATRLIHRKRGKSSTWIQDHDIRFGGNIPRKGIKESTKANKVDSFFVESTGIAADLMVLLFYGIAAERESE